MPQLWRLRMYKRSLDGASPEQLESEFGLPAEEIATRLEATRLCLERQCLLTFSEAAGDMAQAAPNGSVNAA